jgi:hypothetical protein
LSTIHSLASRHRLATLIASATLLLAAAAPMTAHDRSGDAPDHVGPATTGSFEGADEVDGWEAGEKDEPGTASDSGTVGQDTSGTDPQTPDVSKADDDGTDVEDANDDDSGETEDVGESDSNETDHHDSSSSQSDGQGKDSSWQGHDGQGSSSKD